MVNMQVIKFYKYGEVNYEIVKGSDFIMYIEYYADNNTPIDITGYTFTLELSVVRGSVPDMVITGTVADPLTSKIQFKIESSDFVTLNSDVIYFRAKDDDGAGNEYYQLVGTINQVAK